MGLILLLFIVDKESNGAAVDINQVISNFTEMVESLQENFNIQKSTMESTISNLQAEIEANKLVGQNNAKLFDKTVSDNIDALSSTVNRLDKMSKMGTSCTQLAHLGNSESGYYLLDTDGINGNQPPYDAYCKMPERQTFVGNDTVFEFERCDEEFCSEKIIEIDAPMPQMVLLLEESPHCKQEITFHCFLAPVMFITLEGPKNYLQWRDRHHRYHNFSSTMGSQCNKKWPIKTKDSIELNDPALLPVTGIRYGPLRFESQQAQISVGSLNVNPMKIGH